MNETKDELATYTIHEAAELLHLSPITVRRYVTEGKIRGFKIGRSLRVTRAAIEDFIKAAEEKLKNNV